MTEENRGKNIQEEIERADELIKAAQLLGENDLFNDAVSRLYYFLLHNVRALLLTKGLEPKSHEGVLRLFSLHFIKTNIFEPNFLHIFSKMMKYREEADYNPSYTFTGDDFKDFYRDAQGVSDRIRDYLRERGYF
ncbi:MAG: HEPN domain-containing protein [bacterium]